MARRNDALRVDEVALKGKRSDNGKIGMRTMGVSEDAMKETDGFPQVRKEQSIRQITTTE
jgi:hypothetical protein